MTSESTNKTRMYWLQAITPLHVGAGKGIGFIDMPIMREKVTTWPLVPGSSVKGVMRDHFTQKLGESDSLIDVAFGQKGMDVSANAGSLVLTDAHIVCMPVRSLYGTFAYVTCPMALERLRRDLSSAGYKDLPTTPAPGEKDVCHTRDSALISGTTIFLEDLDLVAKTDLDKTGEWAIKLSEILFSDSTWQDIFKKRFAVVSDNCFTFLAETGTDVAARVKIKEETKIVAKGALWYEESLPSEAILAGIAWCDRIYKNNGTTPEKILDTFCSKDRDLDIQIGGKANVGKGRVRCRFTGS